MSRVLPWLRGTAGIAYLADGAGDVYRDSQDPNSLMRRRLQAAIGEQALLEQQGASAGRQAGARVGNALGTVWEGAKSLLVPHDSAEFVRGLFGMGDSLPTMESAPPSDQNAFVEAVMAQRERNAAQGGTSAGQKLAQAAGASKASRGYELGLDQIQPFLSVFPRGSAAASGPKGKDLAMERAIQMIDNEVSRGQSLTEEEQQKLFRQLRDMYMQLSGVSALDLQMMQPENNG